MPLDPPNNSRYRNAAMQHLHGRPWVNLLFAKKKHLAEKYCTDPLLTVRPHISCG